MYSPFLETEPDSPAVCKFSCAFLPQPGQPGSGVRARHWPPAAPRAGLGEGAGCKQLVLILEAAHEMPVTVSCLGLRNSHLPSILGSRLPSVHLKPCIPGVWRWLKRTPLLSPPPSSLCKEGMFHCWASNVVINMKLRKAARICRRRRGEK